MDYTQLFNTILPMIPARYAADATTIMTLLVSLCAVIARFWPRPADSSAWLPVYTLINSIGLNNGAARNADDSKATAATASDPAAKL